MRNLVPIVVLMVLGGYGYSQYQRRAHALEVLESPAPLTRSLGSGAAGPDNTYKCDGRTYCSQMTSCAEANYFLQNCPGTKMDGNNDGIPCEKQWCK